MFTIELARLISAEHEREVEAELRRRRLLGRRAGARRPFFRPMSPAPRAASADGGR